MKHVQENRSTNFLRDIIFTTTVTVKNLMSVVITTVILEAIMQDIKLFKTTPILLSFITTLMSFTSAFLSPQ